LSKHSAGAVTGTVILKKEEYSAGRPDDIRKWHLRRKISVL
jgi:hypothetical protein